MTFIDLKHIRKVGEIEMEVQRSETLPWYHQQFPGATRSVALVLGCRQPNQHQVSSSIGTGTVARTDLV